ncbi:hypothetical protein GCM10010885_00610 [Alicyclobacillus cellulosilyticus]|uniref:O-antigen ligase-related domain-containing protein n=1 Tax=Alicyclobacillus cellulosilyticus TaxID=1003997 RepID=A0A917K2F3_9BACL|nr:O-antigen ligase family protein [Alicyclobacillus cellulosilyticus]GGI94983.1 hypothetical protein GCM10010885_00610 [Alicyclobacillus cellulosilyticus]
MMGQAEAVSYTKTNVGVSMLQHRWLRWIPYALAIFPLVDFTLRMHGIHPVGVIWDKVVLIVLAVWAGLRYVAGFRPAFHTWYRFAGWFILFTMGLMFAGLAHPVVAIQGFRIDVYYILYALLLPFAVEAKDVPKLLHLGVSLAILIGLHGIYQYIMKTPTPSAWVNVGEHVRTRVFSVLQSPNELGSYMALMSPLLIGFSLYEQHRLRKWVYAAGALFCLIAMLLTFTRGAWMALALAVFVMAVLFERRLLILLLLLALAAFFVPPIHHRIEDLLTPVYWIKSAQAGRIARWLTAFDTMSTNPLLGIGVGHYGGAVAAIYLNGTYSDNYYAKTLGETGIIGLTLFIAMHLALFRDLFQKCISAVRGKKRYVMIGGVTGLLAVLIHNSLENVFEFAPMAATYFVYAALLLIWAQAGEDEHAEV